MAKKIILLCAGGMSTSMLVKKMQEAAAADGHPDWEIAAYPQADAKEQGANASCILLGPQIRFAKDKVDMKIYGRMDGKGAIDIAKKLMGV